MAEEPMSHQDTVPAITPEMMAEMRAAIERATKGVRDPEKMRQACERMDRTREEIFKRWGLLDFAVPTIRALRSGDEE
jgi:hypothetical protein